MYLSLRKHHLILIYLVNTLEQEKKKSNVIVSASKTHVEQPSLAHGVGGNRWFGRGAEGCLCIAEFSRSWRGRPGTDVHVFPEGTAHTERVTGAGGESCVEV